MKTYKKEYKPKEKKKKKKAPVKKAKKWGGGGAGKANRPAQPPKHELKADQKWCVEHQTAAQGVVELTADQVKKKHAVYIYGCTGATFVVHGKANRIAPGGRTLAWMVSSLTRCAAKTRTGSTSSSSLSIDSYMRTYSGAWAPAR